MKLLLQCKWVDYIGDSLHCIAYLQERESVEKLRRMDNAMQRIRNLVCITQQRLYELCFLQKLSCQKPCWDQAKLSSLVNKQFGVYLDKGRVFGSQDSTETVNYEAFSVLMN